MNNIDIDEESVYNSILNMLLKYIKNSPFSFNSDDVVARNIILGLTKNKILWGYAYCPCRVVDNPSDADFKNICPCYDHKTYIKKYGFCECGLLTM